jgi:predicted signal transduction protein with EAL and GGDEF domain
MIKLDKSFVDTITVSPPQYELVKGIIGLAHALRVAVDLFVRPMSAEDALARVTRELVGPGPR